jgi:uncharacterized integral membrane protein
MNRWVHFTIIGVVAAITLIFFFQNFEMVTFSFLGLRLTMPLAIVIIIFYFLGLLTGGSLISGIRWMARGVQQQPPYRS